MIGYYNYLFYDKMAIKSLKAPKGGEKNGKGIQIFNEIETTELRRIIFENSSGNW